MSIKVDLSNYGALYSYCTFSQVYDLFFSVNFLCYELMIWLLVSIYFTIFGSQFCFTLPVTVYMSPIRALNFRKDHAQDVDFLLVAVHMQEVPGFQFHDMAIKMHKNIQVISKYLVSYRRDSYSYIKLYTCSPLYFNGKSVFKKQICLCLIFEAVMSTTITIEMIRKCVRLGACFLEKKPLDSVAICNLWQHVDLGPRRIEMIRNLFPGCNFHVLLIFLFYNIFLLFHNTTLCTFSTNKI